MAKRRTKKKPESSLTFKQRRHTRETVHRDREYGMFWYAWLWDAMRPVIIFICAILIVVGLVSTAWNKVYSNYIAAPYPDDPSTPGFTILSGESITTIGKHLEQQGYIKSPSLFKYYIQFYGLTNAIQSGVYYIPRSLNLFDLVNTLSAGNATNERTIRIIPGWTCEDIAEYLVTSGALKDTTEFLNACKDYESYLGYSLALINASENADLSKRIYPLEGYLAPDTYRIYLTADASSIVKTLLKQTDSVYASVFTDTEVFDENGKLISGGSGYGTDKVRLTESEIITLASIIEKEATTPEDMKRVSAVFYNRLAKSDKLQSDPTATYLTDTTRLALTEKDTGVKTAYNTYQIKGLPVGPICNPSKNALDAALHPDEAYLKAGYYYFCAAEPGTGKLVYAIKLEEHEANVAKYRPLWQAYDRQQNAN